MSQRSALKVQDDSRRNLWPVGLGFAAIVIVGVYFGFVRDDANEMAATPSMEQSEDLAANTATQSPNPFSSPVVGQAPPVEADGGALLPLPNMAPDNVAKQKELELTGMSAEELLLLHAQQQQDVNRLLGDLDAVAIEPAGGDGSGMTVREIQAMHAQQTQQIASETDVVIPSADGALALTVADLRTKHQVQEQDLAENESLDEVVIAGSDSSTATLTRADILALHERQHSALQESGASAAYDYSAPGPDAGGPHMTVDEIQDLHDRQSQD